MAAIEVKINQNDMKLLVNKINELKIVISNSFDNKFSLEKLKKVCIKITDGSHNPPPNIRKSNFLMLSLQSYATNING